jgi:hypothetical protein
VRKIVDERLYLTRAKGGGMLRREIWVDVSGKVVRYNLAYIDPIRYPYDNGRVLGYDNAHGEHHRHFFGEVTSVSLTSFAQIERRFERDWQALVRDKDAQN